MAIDSIASRLFREIVIYARDPESRFHLHKDSRSTAVLNNLIEFGTRVSQHSEQLGIADGKILNTFKILT